MESEALQVVWSKNAEKQLARIFEYIVQESFQYAERVVDGIVSQVSIAAKNPERYPPDKYKINNDGSFRVLTKYHYRVSYRVKHNCLRVLRIRHTSRLEKPY